MVGLMTGHMKLKHCRTHDRTNDIIHELKHSRTYDMTYDIIISKLKYGRVHGN